MAEIRIESKPVFLWADHLYLVFVADSGDEFVIRGGPQNDDVLNFGPITTEAGTFMSPDTTEDYRPVSDRDKFGSSVLDLGDRDAADVWLTMRSIADMIQTEKIPYNPFGPNSNSVVASVMHAVGLDVAAMLPDAPGIDSFPGFDDALQDDFQRYFGDGNTSNGKDILVGGSLDDLFVANPGNDVLDGGAGIDLLAFWNNQSGEGATVDLGRSGINASSLRTGSDQVRNIENVIGGLGDDSLTGDAKNNELFGWSGADHLAGGNGDDILCGSWSFGDTLNGGAGVDILDGGGGGGAVLTGGANADAFYFRDNYGKSTVKDFQPGADLIAIEGSPGAMSDITFSATGAGIEAAFAGNTVLFEGLFAAPSADHFVFL